MAVPSRAGSSSSRVAAGGSARRSRSRRHREGARVGVHYHRAADGATGPRADPRGRRRRRGVRADLADGDAGARRSSQAMIAAFGRLDGLVNNAGLTQVGPFLALEPDEWDA